MSDRIETGAGEVAADEDDLAQAGKQKAGLMGGAVRALGRRIEGLSRAIVDLGDSLRGRISRGEDRIDALEKEGAELAQYVRRLDSSAHARLSAIEAAERRRAIDIDPKPSLGAWMDRIQGAVAKLQAAETQHAGKAETMTALTMANLRASKHATRLESLETRLAAIDRTVSAQGQRIGDIEDRAANLYKSTRLRSEQTDERYLDLDRSLKVALSRIGELEARVGVGRPADPVPSSPELGELRAARPCTCGDLRRVGMHRWYGQPCDVQPTGGVVAPRNPAPKIGEPFPSIAGDPLSPPPIARAIGRAVMAAAERLPKIIVPVRGVTVTCHRLGCSNPTFATNRTNDGMWFGVCDGCRGSDAAKIPDPKAEAAARLSRACERIRDFWEKPGGGKDSLLVSLVETLIAATADAKRAGVIP